MGEDRDEQYHEEDKFSNEKGISARTDNEVVECADGNDELGKGVGLHCWRCVVGGKFARGCGYACWKNPTTETSFFRFIIFMMVILETRYDNADMSSEIAIRN